MKKMIQLFLFTQNVNILIMNSLKLMKMKMKKAVKEEKGKNNVKLNTK